jgi:methylthioribose-1-phosphate isomerase
MEPNKALTSDQLEKLKTNIRQRFDELYQRIGSNRPTLVNKVLAVDQAITKELTKEKIDTAREKAINNKVRETEREANNQLPHVQKKPTASIPSPVAKAKKK